MIGDNRELLSAGGNMPLPRQESDRIKDSFGRWINDPAGFFCIIALFALLVVTTILFCSHGSLLERYLFQDTRDTGMDYFHSIEYLNGSSPYEKFHTLYPPFANLIFLVLLGFVPTELSNGWAPDYNGSIMMRGTEMDLRTFQSPAVLFIGFEITMAVAITLIVLQLLRNRSSNMAKTVAICFITSYGALFSFERGNIILLAFVCSLFFFANKDSDSAILRELSLFALAAAAAIKLYPILFIAILIKKRRISDVVRVVAYTVLLTIFPIFFFKEGLGSLTYWLSATLSFGSGSTQPWIGYGFSNLLHRGNAVIGGVLGFDLYGGWFTFAAYAVTAILFVLSLIAKKEWESAFILVMAMLMYHSQADYFFVFFLIPLVLLLSRERCFSKEIVAPYCCLLLMTINLPLFTNVFFHYPRVMLIQIVLVIALCWCVVVSVGRIQSMVKKGRHAAP